MEVAIKSHIHEDLDTCFVPSYPTTSFAHPAYADSNDVLFKLPRPDHTEDDALTGVHRCTSPQACQIIANNPFHGFLATDQDGENAIAIVWDGLFSFSSVSLNIF